MRHELPFEHCQGVWVDFERGLPQTGKSILIEISLSALWKFSCPHSFPETMMFKHKAYIKIVKTLVVLGEFENWRNRE